MDLFGFRSRLTPPPPPPPPHTHTHTHTPSSLSLAPGPGSTSRPHRPTQEMQPYNRKQPHTVCSHTLTLTSHTPSHPLTWLQETMDPSLRWAILHSESLWGLPLATTAGEWNSTYKYTYINNCNVCSYSSTSLPSHVHPLPPSPLSCPDTYTYTDPPKTGKLAVSSPQSHPPYIFPNLNNPLQWGNNSDVRLQWCSHGDTLWRENQDAGRCDLIWSHMSHKLLYSATLIMET